MTDPGAAPPPPPPGPPPGLAWVVGFVAMIIVAVATLGLGLFAAIPLLFALQIGSIVLMVWAAVAANRGERYRYPINIRFVKP